MSDPRVVIRHTPLNAETPMPALGEPITAAGLHYVRTNFPIPQLDAASHHVTLEGAVRHPVTLSMDDLARFPRRSIGVTLECAGNDRLTIAPLPAGELWGGGAVGAAEWSGVSLADVLATGGVRDDALEVLVEGADGGRVGGGDAPIRFARSLPLKRALHPDTLLATEMNGRPIPREHGAPVRLLVPGWYGMASVKWVTRISVLTQPFDGYFQRERYVMDRSDGSPVEPVGAMEVKSMFISPGDGDVLATGRIAVHGWAWSGAGPVTRVEVAVDGGDDWREARVAPPAGGYLWQRWEYDWDVADAGRHTLRVRAHDQAGRMQPDASRWNRLGYCANGVRSVVVDVR